jgi:hypothetical protein
VLCGQQSSRDSGPLSKSGEKWPKAQRKLLLQLLEGSFDLICEDGDAGN